MNTDGGMNRMIKPNITAMRGEGYVIACACTEIAQSALQCGIGTEILY